MKNESLLNENLIQSGQTVGVALSGGKDSMFLLDLLISRKDCLNVNVVALNVDHGIRGEESVKDSQFVENYCKSRNIPLRAIKVNSPSYAEENKLSVEEGARKLRYEFFLKEIEDGFCDVVATAHHSSDFTETVLFNLFRGASPSGLGGIPETSYDGKIIRPILKVDKEDIDGYIKENNIPFVTDETNFSSDYSRNFIRLEIIPKIKSKFPGLDRAVMRFSEILDEENVFLNSEVDKVLIEKDSEISIPIDLPTPLYSRACVEAMKRQGIVKDYEKAHIDGLLELKGLENGKSITLPRGVVAIKNYGVVTVYKSKEKRGFSTPFIEGKIYLPEGELLVEKSVSALSFMDGVLNFDGDKIPEGAKVRYREKGDYFTKFGGGTKSLGDFFTDKKIPLKDRDFIPLVAKGNEILIVCGVEISQKIKVDQTTKNTLTIKYKR